MPHDASRDKGSVMFNEFPSAVAVDADDAFMAEWDRLHAVRDDVKKAVELARKDKLIGASLDAKVTVFAKGEWLELLKNTNVSLAALFITSKVEVIEGEGGAFAGDNIGVTVEKAGGCKCERCWTYSETVGANPEYEGLCERCAKILKGEL